MESMTSTLTHRRATEGLLDGHVILFAEAGHEHYGAHIWTLETALPAPTEALVAWTADYYGVAADEARPLVDPEHVVEDAGAWDDPEYVSALWQAMETGAIEMAAGYQTQDGAVVIDRVAVAMHYQHEED